MLVLAKIYLLFMVTDKHQSAHHYSERLCTVRNYETKFCVIERNVIFGNNCLRMLIGLKQQDGKLLVACFSGTNLSNTSSTTVYIS